MISSSKELLTQALRTEAGFQVSEYCLPYSLTVYGNGK